MIAFEVFRSGKRICCAGVGKDGVLSANATWVGSPKTNKKGIGDIFLQVAGLHSPSGEHRHWTHKTLKVGDEINIRVILADRVDKPKNRSRIQPKKVARARGKR